MATDDDDPYVKAGAAIAKGTPPATSAPPADPYVAAGQAIAAQTPPVTTTTAPPPEMPSGDTQLTTAQVTEEQAREANANKSGYFALEPKEPGFNHLLWSLGAPFFTIGQTATGERPLPTGTNALQMAAPLAGAGDLRFGTPAMPPVAPAPPPDAYVAANAAAAKEAPLSADFRADPMTPEAKAKIAESAPPTPPSSTGGWQPVQPNEVFQPGQQFRMNQTTGQSEVYDPPPGASSPTGIPVPPTGPPDVPAVPPTPITAPPGTSAYAKQIAGAWYDLADKTGGTLTPQFTNKFLDSIANVGKQTEGGQVFAGPNPVGALLERAQSLRDKPMTLPAAQEIDEALGDLITKEYGIKGLSPDGQKLAQIQSNFRDQIQNAGPGDITGGSTGFDALAPARQAWSQAMKMDDLERIQSRANMTNNPDTSFKTQIRTLINSRTKSRGYSPDELAALQTAADRGFLGSALHVFGSRLLPIGVAAASLHSGGVMSALVDAAATHGVTSILRGAATGLANRRVENALSVLSRRVPPNPNPLTPPP